MRPERDREIARLQLLRHATVCALAQCELGRFCWYDGLMRGRALPAFAILSMAVGSLLLIGYVARFAVYRVNNSPANYRITSFGMEEGSVRLWTQLWQSPPPKAPASMGGQSDYSWRFRIDKRAILGFVVGRARAPDGSTSLAFFCPIWILELVCWIPPVIWYRQRRKKEDRGFEVIESAVAD